MQQAVRIRRETEKVSDQALERVVENKKPLTIRSLWKQEQLLQEASQTQPQGSTRETDAFLSARRQLEEVRLAMTVQANYGL